MPSEAENYVKLVHLAPVGCLVVADGVIESVNVEVVELTGIPEHRMLGVALDELLLPEFQSGWRRLTADAAAGLATMSARLATNLLPIELRVRRLSDHRIVVGVRSRESEHRYSALAGADLTHDQVTGLANRHHVLALLHQRMTAADRTPLALIGLWVDDLAQLAETRGERAVDRVVREVGQRLQGRLRSPDVLGRFDQAGFLGLLSSEAPPDQLKVIAERMRAEVAFPVEVDSSLVSFTATVAVASLTARRPSIERALSQLEAVAGRAAAGGSRTEVLDL